MRVKFTYYKESGKWYSSETLDNFPGDTFYKIIANARAMLLKGHRPGLVDGYDLDVVITLLGQARLSHLFKSHVGSTETKKEKE